MGLMAKDSGGGYDPVEAGVYHGICYAVVDLGTQFSTVYNTESRKVLLMWELPTERIKVKGEDLPRAINRTFTLSLNKKANLRQFLESWRGKEFTEAELKGFDMKNLIGVNCQLNIIHSTRNGKTYADVASATPLLKGTEKRALENAPLYFSFDDNMELPEHCPDWVAERVQKSAESTGRPGPDLGQHDQTGAPKDDDIPF
jgi:hypothetical protein